MIRSRNSYKPNVKIGALYELGEDWGFHENEAGSGELIVKGKAYDICFLLNVKPDNVLQFPNGNEWVWCQFLVNGKVGWTVVTPRTFAILFGDVL